MWFYWKLFLHIVMILLEQCIWRGHICLFLSCAILWLSLSFPYSLLAMSSEQLWFNVFFSSSPYIPVLYQST
jgi:hypothetical protein